MRYTPTTPAALQREANAVLGVLAVARANMDRLHYPTADENTTTGTCYEDDQPVNAT